MGDSGGLGLPSEGEDDDRLSGGTVGKESGVREVEAVGEGTVGVSRGSVGQLEGRSIVVCIKLAGTGGALGTAEEKERSSLPRPDKLTVIDEISVLRAARSGDTLRSVIMSSRRFVVK